VITVAPLSSVPLKYSALSPGLPELSFKTSVGTAESGGPIRVDPEA
jgi:hypothetical protein